MLEQENELYNTLEPKSNQNLEKEAQKLFQSEFRPPSENQQRTKTIGTSSFAATTEIDPSLMNTHFQQPVFKPIVKIEEVKVTEEDHSRYLCGYMIWFSLRFGNWAMLWHMWRWPTL